jgi:hypothetical protein
MDPLQNIPHLKQQQTFSIYVDPIGGGSSDHAHDEMGVGDSSSAVVIICC